MKKRADKDPWKIVTKTAALMAAISFTSFMVYLFIPRVKQLRELNKTAARLEQEEAALDVQVNSMVKNRISLQTDKDFVRRIAHEQGLVEEGETIVRFLDEPTH